MPVYNTEEELKKAVDLFIDHTYTDSELKSHIRQVIIETIKPELFHKDRLEYFLYKYQELRVLQQKYFSGNKKLLPECKTIEAKLDDAVKKLLLQGYSIEKYTKPKEEQSSLFK